MPAIAVAQVVLNATHGDESVRRGAPAQCPDRGRLAAVPLGGVLPSKASAEGKHSLFGRFSGTMPRPNSHPRACSLFGCCLHEPARLASPGTDETSHVPCKELLHVHKVSDCARFFPCKPFAVERCCLLFSRMRSAPRNWTRSAAQYLAHGLPCERFTAALASRTSVHHSGSGRLAKPSPWGTSTSYSLPASWRTLLGVRAGKSLNEHIESA
jgi:hypothetical protein